MKHNYFKTLFCVLICIILVFSFSVTAFCSSNSKEKFANDTNMIIGVAKGGDTSLFPENSAEALSNCSVIGLDAVSSRVRITSDGECVLFEDETTSRMCVDSSGKTVKMKISDLNYKTLESYNLLSGRGGKLSKKTNYKVSSLKDALLNINERLVVILDCEENDLDTVYNNVALLGRLDNVFFRCREMKNKSLYSWSLSKEIKPNVIAFHKSNVIFSAIKEFNFAKNNAINCIQFATSNQYGVIFSDFFSKRFGSTRAMASVCEKDFCGSYPDSVNGWESLISKGYSVIESENAAELAKYIQTVDTAFDSLGRIYASAEKLDKTGYSFSSVKDFEKKMNTASQILNGERTPGESQIAECSDSLEIAVRNLTKDKSSSKKGEFKITLPKILWSLFAIALFVGSQAYIFNKRKQKNK